MYIHLGNNYVIPAREIVAIINIENSLSNDLEDIIDNARLDKILVNISELGKEKTLLITDKKVYLSPISSITLYRRSLSHYKEG